MTHRTPDDITLGVRVPLDQEAPIEHLYSVPVTVTYEGVATIYAPDRATAADMARSGAWDELSVTQRTHVEVRAAITPAW